jgi:hypothetical protein
MTQKATGNLSAIPIMYPPSGYVMYVGDLPANVVTNPLPDKPSCIPRYNPFNVMNSFVIGATDMGRSRKTYSATENNCQLFTLALKRVLMGMDMTEPGEGIVGWGNM